MGRGCHAKPAVDQRGDVRFVRDTVRQGLAGMRRNNSEAERQVMFAGEERLKPVERRGRLDRVVVAQPEGWPSSGIARATVRRLPPAAAGSHHSWLEPRQQVSASRPPFPANVPPARNALPRLAIDRRRPASASRRTDRAGIGDVVRAGVSRPVSPSRTTSARRR